jgi:hypothetical protein
VEQSPEDEGRLDGLPTMGAAGPWRGVSALATGTVVLGKDGRAFQRQEGNDAGDGERLHERSKALKGKPHERIWHETRPAGSGRTKAP